MDQDKDIAKVIEHARLIATAAHFGQFRRDGITPYITHPEAVASAVEDRLKPIAWLHDVLEDTWITSLNKSGLPEYVVKAVTWLSRPTWCLYMDYIDQLIRYGRQDAIKVKLADISHNLSCHPSQNSIEKSRWAIPMLEAALKNL